MGQKLSRKKKPEIKHKDKEPVKPEKKNKPEKPAKSEEKEKLKQTSKATSNSVITFFINILDRLFFAPMQGAEPCIGNCFQLSEHDFDSQQKPSDLKSDKEANDDDEETEISNAHTNICLSLKLEKRFLVFFERRKKKARKANERRRKKRREMTPLWDNVTYYFLERLYHTVGRDTQDGTFTLKHFVAACARVGYRVTAKGARDRFWNADTNKDGFLNMDEFMMLTYFFDPPKKNEKLTGLGLYCALAATAEKFIKDLDGEQRLMFGLV